MRWEARSHRTPGDDLGGGGATGDAKTMIERIYVCTHNVDVPRSIPRSTALHWRSDSEYITTFSSAHPDGNVTHRVSDRGFNRRCFLALT